MPAEALIRELAALLELTRSKSRRCAMLQIHHEGRGACKTSASLSGEPVAHTERCRRTAAAVARAAEWLAEHAERQGALWKTPS